MEFPRDDCIAMAELIVADAMAEWKVPGLAVAIRPPLRPFSRLARRLAQWAPGRPTGQAPPRADSLFGLLRRRNWPFRCYQDAHSP
jgi:hypothetical protein